MKMTYQPLLVGITFVELSLSPLLADGQSDAALLKQAKISKTQAEYIAMAKVPGAKIQSAEIENEHRALVWSFDMVKTGSKNVTEVLVDAKTGKIVEVTTETPNDQAKEHAADKASGQH